MTHVLLCPVWLLVVGGLVAMAVGYLLGVVAAGRLLVPLYRDRITYLEYQLALRGVKVTASMR